eukprot:scaffold4060_cov234-Pinguiococcus_pyrenoidosus.AAC.2
MGPGPEQPSCLGVDPASKPYVSRGVGSPRSLPSFAIRENAKRAPLTDSVAKRIFETKCRNS